MSSFTLQGQEIALKLLSAAIELNRIAPAYLFAGAAGVGKATAARAFVEQIFMSNSSQAALVRQKLQHNSHPDLLWVEPTYLHQGQLITRLQAAHQMGLKPKGAPQIRIEQIRQVGEFLSRPPLEAPRSIVIIEAAETMAEAAANALLKTLEEPGGATIILTTADSNEILPTLVSRCQQIPFSRLSSQTMQQVLTSLGYGEIVQHQVLFEIAAGSPGAAVDGWSKYQSIPDSLRQQLQQPPKNNLERMAIAAETAGLELETQLWLTDYLQHYYWRQYQQWDIVQLWQQAHHYLRQLVTPRLVWECTLLAIN